jgi:capsular exopolysaccharide synthesis family protein
VAEHPQDESVLRDWLSVLARQKWIVLLAVAVVPLLAFATSRGQERLYQASADVLVNAQNPTAQALNLTAATDSPPDRYVATQAKLARVGRVASMALQAVNVRDRTAAGLLANSSVSADLTSDLLTFSVKDPSPTLATKLANSYAKQFTLYRRSLDGAGLSAAIADAQRKVTALAASGDGRSELSRRLTATTGDLEALQTLQAVGSSATVVGFAGSASLVQPKTTRNVILGVIVGLALGIAIAFIREALDTRVRSADELRARLAMPLLGQISKPSLRLPRSQELATSSNPMSASTEPFRMLENRVEILQLENPVGSIVLTSPREDEDTSTTAANLAVALAQSGRHVILLDLDLRNPRIDRLFGLHDLGFTDVAMGFALTEALNVVDVNNGRPAAGTGMLEVLTAGERPPDPGELLSSRAAAETLAALDRRCEVLLINTPPVLAAGDAMTIAKHTDGVILLAEVNRVRRATLVETRQVLDGCPAMKLGVIATDGRAPESSSYPQLARAGATAARRECARWGRLGARSARTAGAIAGPLLAALSASVESVRARRFTRTPRTGRRSGVRERAHSAGGAELQESPKQVPRV